MHKVACGLFTFAVVASLCSPALAQAGATPVAPALPRAVVIDADGRRIGSLAGPNRILYDFPDGSAIVTGDANGLVAFPPDDPYGSNKQFYYESADCTGQAYGAPGQIPALGAVSLKIGTPGPGSTLAGQMLYAARERTSRKAQSWLDTSTAGAYCMDGLVTMPRATYNAIRSSALPSYKLPLSIAVAEAPSTSSLTSAGQATRTGIGVNDAEGKYVGNILDQDVVWLKFSDGEAAVKTSPGGVFVDNWLQTAIYYFTTTDCSGAGYFQVEALPTKGIYTSPETVGAGGSILYPKKPFEIIAARSSRRVAAACNPVAPRIMAAGKVGQARLAVFKPPLTIK